MNDRKADICLGLTTNGEATEALKTMKVNTAPGLDGLSLELYKEFLDEIQDLVLQF